MADATTDWDEANIPADTTQPIKKQVEDDSPAFEPDVTRSDRFNSVLVVIAFGLAALAGLFLLGSDSSSLWSYSSREAGIDAVYPAGWLSDEEGDYIVRLRDPASRPFKTQYIIRVIPASQTTSVRNILDELTIQRSVDLSAYRVLNVESVTLNGIEQTQMNFVFVDADPDPFSQRVPTIVQGTDVVIIDEGRALVVTYMANDTDYAQGLGTFQTFLGSLRY